MWGRLAKRTSGIAEAAAVLAVASLVSKVFGVLRNVAISYHYGAGDVSDAFIAAFIIPDFIYSLLILGALSSAFIPIFVDYLNKQGNSRDDAWALVNSILNLAVIVLAAFLLLATIFAPELVHLVAPGFQDEKKDMVINLMRVMFLSPLFFALSNIAGGILNSFKNFIAYAIAPIFYNVGIIIGVLFLVPQFGYMGLAYGVVLGALLQMLIQVPGVFNLGYKYKFVLDIHHPALKKMAQLMVPRTMGVAVAQVNVMINAAIASTLGNGSVYVYKVADDLQSLPIGIFGISFAVAVFPTLAEKYSLSKLDEFSQDIVQVARQILFFIIPSMVIYWLLRAQIVRLIYGYGAFGWDATRFTVSVLAFFTFGMVAQALIHLLARSFYALQDTKTPLISSLIALGLNVVLALILVKYLAVVGLAAAVSIAALVNMTILFVMLSRKLGGLPWGTLVNNTAKIVAASLIMGGAGYGLLRFVEPLVDTRTFVGLLVQTLFTLGISGFVYVVAARMFQIPEVEIIMKPLKIFTRWRRKSAA